MSKYILLAETGSDIPAAFAHQYGIRTVPMHVTFGDETRDDGTFPVEDIYSFFENTKTLTKTSGSTVDDFTRAFDDIHSTCPDQHILHLAYSAVTTCSYQSARLAAEGREKVTSIDTGHVSAGQSLVLIQVARYLELNPDAKYETVIEKVQDICKRVRMGFFPGDLAYLRAGGRVSNAAYLGAKILSLHPLIELREGFLKATKKYRGKMERVALELLQEFSEANRFKKDIIAFVYSKGLKDSIRESAQAMAEKMGFKEILWIPTGGVVTTHCGPGGFGVCGIAE